MINCIIAVLQGVPSDLFVLDFESFEFSINPNIDLAPLKMTRKLVISYFEEYIEAGSYFLQLSEIAAYIISNPQKSGLVLESFALGLSEFLCFYQYQILNLEDSIIERRIKENCMFEDPQGDNSSHALNLDNLKYRPLTLLELKIHLESLMAQIQLVAFIVIKPYREIADFDRKARLKQEQEINGIMLNGKPATLPIDMEKEADS